MNKRLLLLGGLMVVMLLAGGLLPIIAQKDEATEEPTSTVPVTIWTYFSTQDVCEFVSSAEIMSVY